MGIVQLPVPAICGKDLQDVPGVIALMLADFNGHTGIVQLLLSDFYSQLFYTSALPTGDPDNLRSLRFLTCPFFGVLFVVVVVVVVVPFELRRRGLG